MIYLIVGANAYQAQQELQNLAKGLDIQPDRIDPESRVFKKVYAIVGGGKNLKETKKNLK